MLKTPFNWEKIKRSSRKFIFIASNNDKYDCGESQSRILQEHLGGKLIIKPDEGHFNLEVGEKYKKFPLLLKLI